jgi:hypothetical protein
LAAGQLTRTSGSASEPITNSRSRLKRKLTWPPTTGRPAWRCTKPIVRRSPSRSLATSAKSPRLAPGASSARLAPSTRHAAAAAIVGSATLPATSRPRPQIRDGTPVARSQVASVMPGRPAIRPAHATARAGGTAWYATST